MNKLMLIGSAVALGVLGCTTDVMAAEKSSDYKPAEWNLKARQKFAEQRFGIFIHWGLYANFAQGEWYLWDVRDEAEYARMMHGFYPSKFNAKEWVKIFKDAGAKYITFTSRHHDGFSMWHTKADDGYNIANTPFKRDVIRELSDACQEGGLQLNLYYSLSDFHRPDYPGKQSLFDQIQLPVPRKLDYQKYKKFMIAQITELIDNYKPGNIWFDGEWQHYELDWQLEDIFAVIHSKKVLVANNNHRPPRDSEDIQLFERGLPGVDSDIVKKERAVRQDRPLEQCEVIQPPNYWGYRVMGKNYRSSEEIVAMLARAAAVNANLLMNVGPDGSGQIPARAVKSLQGVGAWLKKNGESIYATHGCWFSDGDAIVSTRRGKTVYLHFLDPLKKQFIVDTPDEIVSATYLTTGKPVSLSRTADGKQSVVRILREKGDKFDVVVKLEFK